MASILDRLQQVFSQIKNYEMNVLVYDSHSPDGTADIVKTYQEKYPNIFLVTEEKKSGLGNVYIQAMKYACDKLNADIVFEFDADGSHNPDYLPAMMEQFTQGADVVVGSRHVKGGSIPKDWGWYRKFLSVVGNIAAKIVLSFKIKDYTTGFRGTRAECFKKINLNDIKSKNYAYKILLMWLLYLSGAKIVEFPIDFVDRQKGYSKLPKNNIIESLWLIFYLRFLMLKRYIKVCMVGGVGLLVQLGIFNALRFFVHPVYANSISFECAVLASFLLNNYYSFSDKKLSPIKQRGSLIKKLFLFNTLALVSWSLQTVSLIIGLHFFGRGVMQENIFVLMGVVLGSVFNYKMYQGVIWC